MTVKQWKSQPRHDWDRYDLGPNAKGEAQVRFVRRANHHGFVEEFAGRDAVAAINHHDKSFRLHRIEQLRAELAELESERD